MNLRLPSLALALFAGAASAQDGDELHFQARSTNQSASAGGAATVIYSNVPGLPNAAVPGLPFEFNPGGSSTSAFDRPFGSPNGNWILTALMETGSTLDDEVIILNDVVVGREGDAASWAPGEAYGTIDTRVEVNDAGDWVFATNTDGPTTADDYVVRGDNGGGFTVIAKEGDAIAVLPTEVWDDTIENPIVQADGSVGLMADGIDGTVPTTQDEILVLGATLLAQEGVTVPPGQDAGGTATWENFDLNDFFASDDGAHWLVQGDLLGTTNDTIVAFDGAVVLQEGVVIPGSGYVDPIDASGVVGVSLDHGANWYARGNNDVTEQDWVVRNGLVIAEVGAAITGSTAEAWSDAEFSDCFFLHTGNAVGDWVVGGVTDGPTDTNGVLVKNGDEVICREGDPLDLDGNGLLDDDAFVNTFGNDDGLLLDDGTFYIVITVRDGAGTATAQAFICITPVAGGPTALCFGDGSGTPCPCGNTGGAGEGCANSTGSGGTMTASGSLSVGADDLEIAGAGLLPNQPALLFVGENSVAGGDGQVFGDGLRCAGMNVVRLGVDVPDGNGDASWGPGLGAIAGWTAGDTRYLQVWYRDPVNGPCGSTFNLTHSIEATFEL